MVNALPCYYCSSRQCLYFISLSALRHNSDRISVSDVLGSSIALSLCLYTVYHLAIGGALATGLSKPASEHHKTFTLRSVQPYGCDSLPQSRFRKRWESTMRHHQHGFRAGLDSTIRNKFTHRSHYPDDVMKTVSVTCQSGAFQRQERSESRVQTLAQTTHSFTFFTTLLAVLQRCNDRYRILFYLRSCHTSFCCFCRLRCAKRSLSNPNNHSTSSCIACMSSRPILKSVVHLVAPLQIQ